MTSIGLILWTCVECYLEMWIEKAGVQASPLAWDILLAQGRAHWWPSKLRPQHWISRQSGYPWLPPGPGHCSALELLVVMPYLSICLADWKIDTSSCSLISGDWALDRFHAWVTLSFWHWAYTGPCVVSLHTCTVLVLQRSLDHITGI